MPPDILGLGLSLLLSVTHAVGNVTPIVNWPQRVFSSFANAKMEPVVFHSAERAVSNWRHDAIWNLAFSPRDVFELAIGKDPNGMSRCVKLNNYWCIKKAGWNGEIASDAEGHVAFASALEGATVAALLLRRYYIDYNRRTAFAIISRWAPAQCGFSTATRQRSLKVASVAGSATLRDVAPHGIQNTLRARWLAGRGHGGVLRHGKALPIRRSIIADPLLRMMPAPEIAVGSGEREINLKPLTFAALGLGLGNTSPPPMTSCASDGPRIQAYASHAAAGVAANVNEDLHLFTDDGVATANLARVMSNMAAVEIGPLSVRDWLVEAGIAAAFHRAPPAQSHPEPAVAGKP